MRLLSLLTTITLFSSGFVTAAIGTQSVQSNHSVATTTDRLESLLKAKGMTVFARIDHAAGAAKVGKQLAPTQLLIFGNPKVGTPLMQCDQTTAIDLPQKALIWQDPEGKVWLTYNDANYLAYRHQLGECADVLMKVSKALGAFAKGATQP